MNILFCLLPSFPFVPSLLPSLFLFFLFSFFSLFLHPFLPFPFFSLSPSLLSIYPSFHPSSLLFSFFSPSLPPFSFLPLSLHPFFLKKLSLTLEDFDICSQQGTKPPLLYLRFTSMDSTNCRWKLEGGDIKSSKKYNLGSWICHILPTTSEKAMATHSSTLAWKIPWAEEPGGLQSMGSQRVRHDWATPPSLFTFIHWRRKWQPAPLFLPGESQGRRSLVGCCLWGRIEPDTTEET